MIKKTNSDNKLKIWFVTDIHGSNVCFRKFLNSLKTDISPDVIILGADISGKYVIPILNKNGSEWMLHIDGKDYVINNSSELNIKKDELSDKGFYPYVCDEITYNKLQKDESFYDIIFKRLRIERLREWVKLTEQRVTDKSKKVIINCGNDDPWYLDEILKSSKTIIVPEGKLLYLNDEITMISTGLANMTPWNCPRDVTEYELTKTIESMTSKVPDFNKCIFNFHCPPINTSLDKAPKLDKNLNVLVSGTGIMFESVGSTAVRASIEKYQPIVSLHGHIHEQHGFEKIGNTICFNPGSEYNEGLLNGVYLEFEDNVLKHYILTREN